jgi:methyl-accepting chemotaxis protein
MLYRGRNGSGSDYLQISNREDLITTLSGILSSLEEIVTASEKQFNLISRQLQHFYHSSKEITRTAANVTGLLTSAEYNSKLKELNEIFKQVNDYLTDNGKNFSLSQKALSDINKHLLQSAEGVAGFKKICRHLEMQSISIKIESSRLGNDDKGFSHLSDDIHKLSESIAKQSNGFKDKARMLLSTTSAVESQVAALIKNQEEYSAHILANTRESINLLSEEYELSSQKSFSITSKAENIQKRTGALVTSIQFHDITRQQMEHVDKVIRDLANKIDEKNHRDEDLQNDAEFMALITTVCKLQSAQMNNSQNELLNAVNEIITSHDIISNEISGVTTDTMALFNNGGKTNNSFIDRVKNGFDIVLNTLIKNEDVKKDFTVSVDNVISTIEELSGFVNEINGIGTEIELLALNANIKAAHTGTEGASLGVLAEAIQRLSSDSRNHTNTVIEILMRTQNVSNELKSLGDNNNSSKLSMFSEKITEIFDLLIRLTDDALSNTQYIQKASSELKKDISDSVKTLNEYLQIKKQIEDIILNLDNVVKYASVYSNGIEFDKSMLEKIGKNYTMQVQRDIHINVTNGTSENNGFYTVDNAKDEINIGLGDNIELF